MPDDNKDPFLLPHPQRLKHIDRSLTYTGVLDRFMPEKSKSREQFTAALRSPYPSFVDHLKMLVEKIDDFAEVADIILRVDPTASTFDLAPSCSGSANSQMAWHTLAFTESNAPIFQIDDDLVQALMLTDVSENIPVSMITPPFTLGYLELGTRRDTGCFVHNTSTGQHPLEGAYISVSGSADRDSDGYGKRISIIFTGSPTRDHLADDAYLAHTILFQDENGKELTVLESITRSLNNSSAWVAEHGLLERNKSFYEGERETITMVIKALLFLNMKAFRKEVVSERDEWLKKARATLNKAKQRKYLQKANASSNKIVIRPFEELSEGIKQGIRALTDSKVAVHLRRGHLRNQAFGPERADRKIIWIEPTLVGMSADETAPVTAKAYVARL